MIDLHAHSTCSDGTDPPARIAELAVEAGLTAMALTDHDTIDGLGEFMAASDGTPLRAVAGVEIACAWYSGTLDILGYDFDHRDPDFVKFLSCMQEVRETRNLEIARKLLDQGIDISYDEVKAEAGGPVIGRPHFARVLMNKGLCPDMQSAFDRFIGRGQCAFVPRFLPLPEEGIAAIHGAGGAAFWAHPTGQSRRSRSVIRRTAKALQENGLDGVEAYYSEYSGPQQQMMIDVAKSLGLLCSGGSDYHGRNSPGVSIGVGRGELKVPDELLAGILKAR